MCGGDVMPSAIVPLWQVEQLVSLGWCVYFPPAQLVNVVAAVAWQVTQSQPLVATCPVNDAVPSAPVVPSLV